MRATVANSGMSVERLKFVEETLELELGVESIEFVVIGLQYLLAVQSSFTSRSVFDDRDVATDARLLAVLFD